MSTITIYKCDKCGEEFKGRAGLLCVHAGIGEFSGCDAAYKTFRADWCVSCAVAFGLPRKPLAAIPAVIPPTLEDMIRDIVRSEVQS